MKKISLLLMTTIALMLTACGGKNKCVVEGTLVSDEYNGKLAYLQGIDDIEQGTLKVYDSVEVKDKKFHFEIETGELPDIRLVAVGEMAEKNAPKEGQVSVGSFAVEPGTVKVDLGKTDLTIGGTKLNDEFNALHQVSNEMSSVFRQISENGGIDAYTSEEQGEMETKLKDLAEKRSELSYAFMKSNMATPLGEFLFLSSMRGLEIDQFKELIALSRDSFKEVGVIKQSLDAIKAQDDKEAAVLNKPYTDVKLTTLKGQTGSLSDFVGKKNNKYVLLDFWASWCPPCIQEMPYLVSTYEKYKAKGFEIVGISLDQDQAAWKKAIKDHKMAWAHFIDTDAVASTTYGADRIPYTLLVDKDGVVVAMNLRGDALAEKLAELMD